MVMTGTPNALSWIIEHVGLLPFGKVAAKKAPLAWSLVISSGQVNLVLCDAE